MFFRKKEKPVNTYDHIMMDLFHQNGGYERNLDIMAWQVGWKTAITSKVEDSKKVFNDLYYGGGSPFPFDEKTFYIAWDEAKNFVKNTVQIAKS